MISHYISDYWFSLLRLPTALSLRTTLLLALPFALWELSQWRLAYMRYKLPFHCYALEVGFALLLGSVATHSDWKCSMRRVDVASFGPTATLIIFPPSVPLIIWKLLRHPFSTPGSGPYVPHLHWSAGVGGS